MKIETKFIRNGARIKNVETGGVVDYKSISKAKRWSREWQSKNGGLGVAGLQVGKF